jgi:hypothetical protein
MSSSDVRLPHSDIAALNRLCTVMCILVVCGAFVGLAVLTWLWSSPRAIETMLAPRLGLALVPIAVDAWTRAVGFLVSMIPMSVLLFLLLQAYRLFGAYRLGLLFTDAAPIRLRRIGIGMIGLALLRPVTATLLGVLLTLANAPGQRIVAIGISIDEYMIAACGGLLMAIGHVMAEAKRIADDNGQII